MKKVGIYSGTFDPVHEGHLAFARDAIEQCGLDKVFFLVEPRPRRKQGVRAQEHRVAMVQLAVQEDARLGSIDLKQPRFTVTETLPVLRERFKGAELYMLMGDDMLSHFGEWPNVDKLTSGVQFVIGLRRFTKEEVQDRLDTLQRTRGLRLRYKVFTAGKPEFSSSSVKRSLRQGKISPGISKKVAEYIREHGLYHDTRTDSK
jgi:nicotinate-nucleotide adenylyltransferase